MLCQFIRWKRGAMLSFYGNRPEQRNPAAMIERGGEFKALEDNVSINIAPRWEIIPKLIVRGQYSIPCQQFG